MLSSCRGIYAPRVCNERGADQKDENWVHAPRFFANIPISDDDESQDDIPRRNALSQWNSRADGIEGKARGNEGLPDQENIN